jgi:hypothetical protein
MQPQYVFNSQTGQWVWPQGLIGQPAYQSPAARQEDLDQPPVVEGRDPVPANDDEFIPMIEADS